MLKRILILTLALVMFGCLSVPSATAEGSANLILTFSCDNDYTGETGICQLTYNAMQVYPSLPIWESQDPVDSLTNGYIEFWHTESDSYYVLRFFTEYASAAQYRNDQVDMWFERTYSDLTQLTIGTIPAYSLQAEDPDNGSYTKDWVVEFPNGLFVVQTQNTTGDFSGADAGIQQLLLNLSVNGVYAGTNISAYTLYDYNTGKPVYNVTFHPAVFALDETCDPASGEMILNYADTSLPYSQMKIYVNKYSSGQSFFSGKNEFRFGIEYSGIASGTYLEEGGMIGDAMSYLGVGLDREPKYSRVFFAEMPDGNVITGTVPGASTSDQPFVPMAFLTVEPVE